MHFQIIMRKLSRYGFVLRLWRSSFRTSKTWNHYCGLPHELTSFALLTLENMLMDVWNVILRNIFLFRVDVVCSEKCHLAKTKRAIMKTHNDYHQYVRYLNPIKKQNIQQLGFAGGHPPNY